MISTRSCFTVIGLVLAVNAGAFAQCGGGDDGFDQGCCVLATANVPSFNGVTMQANWAELKGCGVANPNTVNVSLSPLNWVYCDYALINVFVAFPGGETIAGLLVAKYIRTFTQIPAPNGQIWRFLVNGDLVCTPTTASTPCTSPLPRCSFVPGQLVHFDGHIDYRCLPGTILPTSVSMSLTHHQGCLTHAGFSCAPLAGLVAHVESSYHLVGPAPFFFGPSVAPQGPLTGDAVRTSILRVFPSFIYQCFSEAKVVAGSSLVPVVGAPPSCLCATINGCNSAAIPCTAATACYLPQSLNYGVCCSSGAGAGPFSSFPIPGTPIAATGLVALRLGTWGALPNYPSGVSLTQYFGVVQYTTAFGCVPPNYALHVAVGVATSNALALPFTSIPACGPPAPISNSFIDLMNVLPLSTAPALAPGYGCLSVSDVVWSFNT